MYLKTLATIGLLNDGEHQLLHKSRMDLLQLTAADRIHDAHLDQFIAPIHEIRHRYAAFCDWPNALSRNIAFDYRNNHSTSAEWIKWKDLHNATVATYKLFVDDKRFRGIYSPEGRPQFADPISSSE